MASSHTPDDGRVMPASLPSPVRAVSRWLHLVLAAAFAAAIIAQAFLGGAGLFSEAAYWERHVAFVEWFQPLPVLLVATAFAGRMAWTSRLLPAAAWLGIVVQYELVQLAPSSLAGLHVVNGFLIAYLAVETVLRAWRQRSDPVPSADARAQPKR